MHLNKKQKVIVSSMLEDSITPILLNGVISVVMLQEVALNLIRPLILLPREQHTRIPDFYETWLEKYLDYDFYIHFRMEKKTAGKLLSELGHWLKEKKYMGGNFPVPLEKCMLICVWYLGKGDTIISTADRFNVSISKAWDCINVVLKALNSLITKYITWPTESECRIISEQFYRKHKFPGVIGVIDGSHVVCKIPHEHHASYQDRKFQHSITIQGVCTSSRLFTNISVGYPGSIHDARVLKESALGRDMYNHRRDLFYGEYHLLGDAAYPCKPWLMTPFREAGRQLSRQAKVYNKRLKSARVVIEHVFGLLKGRWRICQYVNVYSIPKAVDIIAACCMLHNFCLLSHDDWEAEPEQHNEAEHHHHVQEMDQEGIAKRHHLCHSM